MLYRHKKRGTVYRKLNDAVLQWSSVCETGVDDCAVIVYQDVDDTSKIWVRPAYEFFDGRFEELDWPDFVKDNER